jgi:hypothetical protein
VVGQVRLKGARIQQWSHTVASCQIRAISGLASRPDQPATKELKASQPNRLEREIARQLANPNGDLVLTLRASLRGRMLYGQSFEDAVSGIVEQCRGILEATPEDERIRKMPTPPFAKKAE